VQEVQMCRLFIEANSLKSLLGSTKISPHTYLLTAATTTIP